MIDSTMKTVWAAELEVLAAVADICAKYQLPWYAYAGTLLGAVRHQGFIPWDDDIDICMLRADFQELLRVLPEELPEGWRIANAVCGQRQTEFWSYVVNADTISIEPERLRRFHGCPFMVSIDIFPLDTIPDDESDRERERALFRLINRAVQLEKLENPTEKERKELGEGLRAVRSYLHAELSEKEDLVSQLWRLANQLCAEYSKKPGKYISNYLPYSRDVNFYYQKEWFADTIYLPFENVEIPVPKYYDEVLKKEFGNYMEPVRGAQDHDYPFYNKQLDMLRDMVKKTEERSAGT